MRNGVTGGVSGYGLAMLGHMGESAQAVVPEFLIFE